MELAQSVASANQLSSAVLDTLANEVVIIGRDGRIVAANARWRGRFPDARLGAPFDLAAHVGKGHGVDPTAFRDRFAQLRAGQIHEVELDVVIPATTEAGRRYMQARFAPIQGSTEQFMGVFTDITELREATVQILHTQKLEAVGQLASGIAHEINTPIQFIGDNLRFIEDGCSAMLGAIAQLEGLAAAAPAGSIDADLVAKIRDEAELDYLGDEIPAALGQALNGVERVARIVRAMKAFGHPGDSAVQHPSDLAELISNALVVAHNEIKYVADVTTDFAVLAPVMCFAGDLGQVILNLLVNAAHAIADRVAGGASRGRIVVRTAQEDQRVVDTLNPPDRWAIEVAVPLSQLGAVTLPQDTLERWAAGLALSPIEERLAREVPSISLGIIREIPRLEVVERIIRGASLPDADRRGRTDLHVGAAIVRLAFQIDGLETSGMTRSEAIDVLRRRAEVARDLDDAAMLGRLARRPVSGALLIRMQELEPGMVLAQDCRSDSGVFLVGRGTVVTPAIIARLRHFETAGHLAHSVVVRDGA